MIKLMALLLTLIPAGTYTQHRLFYDHEARRQQYRILPSGKPLARQFIPVF